MTIALNMQEEKVGPCLVAFQAEIAPDKVEAAMQAAARRVSRNTNIPGFRPGKAPYAMVLRTLGRDNILTEAANDLGDELLREVAEHHDLKLYDLPMLELVERQPLKLKLTFTLQPVVDPGPYRSLRLPPVTPEVIDEARVEKALEQVRRQHATTSTVERPAQLGDVLNMDLRIAEGENVLIDRTAADVELVEGEADISPGFSAAMVGTQKGETRTFDLPVPETDTDSGLAGKTLNVQATVHEVKALSIPAADDEFARTEGRFETLAELRAELRKNLEEAATRLAASQYEEQLIVKALEGARIEYPDRMLEREVELQLNELKEEVGKEGFDFQKWLRMNQLSQASLEATMRPSAEQRLRRSLFISELAIRENLTITPEDVDAHIAKQLERFPEQLREQLASVYQSDEMRTGITLALMQQRTLEKLSAIARGEGVLLPGDAEPGRAGELLIAS